MRETMVAKLASLTVAVALFAASGCGHKVALSYTAPGDVELGKRVADILILDQSDSVAPHARTEALESLRDALQQSSRFDTVRLGDGTASKRDLKHLCETFDCDAVVALSTLTSDDETLVATFRVVSDSGKTLDEATLEIPAREPLADAARELGLSYAARIAPHEATAIRTLYTQGDPALVRGADQVQAGHWRAAEETWRSLVQSSKSPHDIAKARHNLAVAAERAGRLDRALQLARNADDTLDQKRTTDYVLALEQRWVAAR